MVSLFCLLVALTIASCNAIERHHTITTSDVQAPPIPAWPDQFMIEFDVYVKMYGKDWSSTGKLYYDWQTKTFRADYINWCFPLSQSDKPSNATSYTCTFLATEGNMYFVNHTAPNWKQYECCMFQKGLGTVEPDWMKEGLYNGTDTFEGKLVDKWLFPGTNDPLKPCYYYWNAKDDIHTPVGFFGISTVGPTLLSYHDFEPKDVPHDIDMGLPNADCNKECEHPSVEYLLKSRLHSNNVKWPEWPTCE